MKGLYAVYFFFRALQFADLNDPAPIVAFVVDHQTRNYECPVSVSTILVLIAINEKCMAPEKQPFKVLIPLFLAVGLLGGARRLPADEKVEEGQKEEIDRIHRVGSLFSEESLIRKQARHGFPPRPRRLPTLSTRPVDVQF